MFEKAIKAAMQHVMRIPRREAQFCKNQQAPHLCKCTNDLLGSAYEAQGNIGKGGQNQNCPNTVLNAKSACQAAATTAHQVEPSRSRDGAFCSESSDENQICEKAMKNKTAKKPMSACQAATITKGHVWVVIVL